MEINFNGISFIQNQEYIYQILMYVLLEISYQQVMDDLLAYFKNEQLAGVLFGYLLKDYKMPLYYLFSKSFSYY